MKCEHWKWDKLRRNNGCDLRNRNIKNQEKRASFGTFYLKSKSRDPIPKTWEIINGNIFWGKKYCLPLGYIRRNTPRTVRKVEMELGRTILILAFSICYQINQYSLPTSLSFPHGIHFIGFRRCSFKAISRHRASLSARHSQLKSEWQDHRHMSRPALPESFLGMFCSSLGKQTNKQNKKQTNKNTS